MNDQVVYKFMKTQVHKLKTFQTEVNFLK